MDKIQLTLWNPQQGYQEIKKSWDWAKSMLMSGHKLTLSIRAESKSRDQECKYHAMIEEISKQASHLGSTWGAEDWKRLLLDKFARETERVSGKIIPNLDKTGVVEVGLQSRKFTVSDGSEFIEWLHAWGAENGITFYDQR